MAIEFKELVTIRPTDVPEVAASLLEAQLNKHFPVPEYDPNVVALDSTAWRLRNSSESRSTGASTREVFEEFREHDLQPHTLFHDRRLAPAKEGERGVKIHVHYPMYRNEISIEIEGVNRMSVDGVTATFQRIKRTIEKPLDSVGSVTSTSQVDAQQAKIGSPSPVESHGGVVIGGSHSVYTNMNYVENSHPSWVKRTWKDHTATFLITLVAGVLVVAIGLWLGLSPRP